MPMSKSIESYVHILKPIDSLIERGTGGKRFTVETKGAAINLRQSFYYARLLDRRRNTDVYPEGHPSRGTSAYDPIQVSVEEVGNGSWNVDFRLGGVLTAVDID